MCGGTAARAKAQASTLGLSPRVRGNRGQPFQRYLPGGSIPACAGEPGCSASPGLLQGVYPRVCGGTGIRADDRSRLDGLSPRVRGNPGVGVHPLEGVRSIPACAGEPQKDPHQAAPTRVYPRVCGGTGEALVMRSCAWGLSPRVRGNLVRSLLSVKGLGSIPACAGEPARCPPHTPPQWVYPRVCGGTPTPSILRFNYRGLSPRVRGNRL